MSDYQKAYLCKCTNCDFVFSKRIPTLDELNIFYHSYGINNYLSPLTIKRYHELLDKFEAFKKTNKILDIGCGNGYFLDIAKSRGWEVYGTEFSDKAIELCKSKHINMYKGELNPSDFAANYFDVICSIEVIEHINYPNQEINNIHELLRTGGLLYLTTPNFNSLLRYRLKAKYNIITYPEHLSYYTPKTLKRAFASRGFISNKIETTGISITRFRTSKGSSKQKIISSTSNDEIIRNKIEKNYLLQFFKYVLNYTLTLTGTGDSLKAWFIKN